MSEDDSLILIGNMPQYSLTDINQNYIYSKNRFINSIPRPLNLLKYYNVKKLGLGQKKVDKTASWIYPSTSGNNVGPGSYIKNLNWIKEPNKKSYFFDNEKHSSNDNKYYNLPIFNFIQNNFQRNIPIQRNHNKIKFKYFHRSFSGKPFKENIHKESISKLFFNKNDLNKKKFQNEKIEYLPKREIVSIFRSQSSKGIYFVNKHCPGPSYYDPKTIEGKNYFKNTKKIWV